MRYAIARAVGEAADELHARISWTGTEAARLPYERYDQYHQKTYQVIVPPPKSSLTRSDNHIIGDRDVPCVP